MTVRKIRQISFFTETTGNETPLMLSQHARKQMFCPAKSHLKFKKDLNFGTIVDLLKWMKPTITPQNG
jgi:hypothetical protein